MKGIFIFSDMNLIVEVEERKPLTGAPGYDYSTDVHDGFFQVGRCDYSPTRRNLQEVAEERANERYSEIKDRPRRGLYPKVKVGWAQ